MPKKLESGKIAMTKEEMRLETARLLAEANLAPIKCEYRAPKAFGDALKDDKGVPVKPRISYAEEARKLKEAAKERERYAMSGEAHEERRKKFPNIYFDRHK